MGVAQDDFVKESSQKTSRAKSRSRLARSKSRGRLARNNTGNSEPKETKLIRHQTGGSEPKEARIRKHDTGNSDTKLQKQNTGGSDSQTAIIARAATYTKPLISSATYHLPPPPSGTFGGNSTSLAELAHLVRLQSYQQLKHTQSRIRLHRQLISTGISARLERCGALARTHMVDYFKEDKKKEFAVLYNAVYELKDSCERLAMLQPELDVQKISYGDSESERPKSLHTFLQDIPTQTRDTILSFISTLRSNPKFLADRLCKLSPADLDTIAKSNQITQTQESVLPSNRKTVTPNPTAPVPTLAVDKLLAFHRLDPLHTLIHTIFANSSGPDSEEDRRRTDVWSTVCARLLSEKRGEKFLYAVMDSWSSMREWPAKNNIEVCLMKMLQDGASVLMLDRQDDGTDKVRQDLIRKQEEEFYVKATRSLFQTLDDEPCAGGIPEGILELGHAILEKIEDPKRKKLAEVFIVAKWFFGRYLNTAIQYPEYHGIMVGHFISEYARQAILRRVIQRMCTDVFSICFVELKSSRPIDPIVRNHVESIMGRFRNPRPKDSNPILLPVKAITSPRETLEVQPYLVLCPTDIVTVFHALYPQSTQRPATSSSEKDFGSKKFGRSVTSARPAVSRPASIFENTGTASLLSQSNSSVNSDSGLSSMNAPLLDNQYGSLDEKYAGSLVGSPNSFTIAPNIKSSTASIYSLQSIASESDDQMETFMYDVKQAVAEMTRSLGGEATSGRIHPCAEKWAVLFVSADGKNVSARMKTDWEDEDDEDSDSSHDSDSEDDSPGEVSRDYNQVKHAIMKLIEEYEVPEELIEEDENQSKKFSNRTSIATTRKHATPVASTVTSYIQDQNPYYQAGGLSALFNSSPKQERQRLDLPRDGNDRLRQSAKDGNPDVLLTMLSAAQSQCMARGDYVDGQVFHRAVTILLRKLEPSLTRNGFAPLLHILSRGFRVSIEKSAACIEHLEAWFVWLTLAQERHDCAVSDMLNLLKSLRVKMWYVTDVRNSAAYDDARNVALALKKMAIPPKTNGRPVSQQRSKTGLTHRMSTSSFSLLKSDSMIDTIAAPVDNGGPNKLSDDQAEITSAWLKRYSVQNFCSGEERIHRFCFEIDKCVNRLVGDKILTGPVLWSSELFARDEKELTNVRKKGEFHLAGVGGLNMTMDDDSDGEKSLRRQEVRPKASAGDLFGLSIGRPRSQSIVSTLSTTPGARPRTTRGSVSESFMDKNDLFNTPTPQLSLESTPTSAFWSPFGNMTPLAGSPARSKTSSIPTLTTSRSIESENSERKAFLNSLKQTLIGLLLSDLGLDVWSQGSETDAWFSGGLADECLQRKEDQERALAEKNASSKTLTTVASKKINRKKSNKSLRRSVSHANGILEALGRGEKGELAAPVATYETVGPEPHSGEENSSSSDATARSANTATGTSTANKKGTYQTFPYGVAFRRLLTKFSTHPNPFDKLNALYELEILIVASLTSTTGKTFTRRGTLPSSPTPDFDPVARELSARMNNLMLSQPANLDESLAHLDERRHVGLSGSPFLTPTGARSPMPNNIPSTDMIVEVWQELFRQADIRPRTLFRDLQFVASFIPAHQLDLTDQGKAFWDMAYAALTLKLDIVKTMVEVADEIVGYHTKRRTPDSAASTPVVSKEKFDKNPDLKSKSPQPAGTEWIARYSMKDAANMWLITAKEGDATAQRELAIFYLTNPALLPLATMPLSKTKDIFRNDSMVARGVNDPEKCDPLRLCVSHHWMELSAREDELAKKYLRQRDEW
ncbi:hypothetical protein ABW19_dt0203108 [Dactylella cylindrospora]|nr:hypothetical protein ABW19_dt0203108 [Dactylella cylindrospora]